MTVKAAFDEKIKSDMLYYENLLRQAISNNDSQLSENIKIVLSTLYFEIANKMRKKTKSAPAAPRGGARARKKIRAFNFIDEDREFESFTEACNVLGLKSWEVSRALASGEMVDGYFFDYDF